MRITDRLTMIEFSVGQGYLWRDGDELTLIDTGVHGEADRITAAVAALGLGTESITRVLITHGHPDHDGNAATVRSWHGAPVHAHHAEVPFITGALPIATPVLSDRERQIFQEIPPVPPTPGSPVDVELTGGEVLPFGGGAHIIAVPGHTEGSIAVHLPGHGVLLTGDTVASGPDGTVILGVFNTDPARAAESFRAQAALDVDIACFGHGAPVVGGAAERLRTAARAG